MNFDVFSWTMDEVMSNVHLVMKHLTNSFTKKHAPEMKEEHIQTKGLLFYKYFLKSEKRRLFYNMPDSKVEKVQMTE